MIAQLTGRLVRRSPTELVVDVNGVGYSLNISLSTFGSVEHADGAVTILTYLHVREDVLQLFGFATETAGERRVRISISNSVPGLASSAGKRPIPIPIPSDGLCVPLVTSPTFLPPAQIG